MGSQGHLWRQWQRLYCPSCRPKDDASLVLYNVRSELELMDTIPLRLDWPWFWGHDEDSEVPNHSVLSKARARWGVEAGLVDGRAGVITATETTGGDVNEVSHV